MFHLDVADVCRCVPITDVFLGVLPGLECEHIFMRIYMFIYVLILPPVYVVCVLLACSYMIAFSPVLASDLYSRSSRFESRLGQWLFLVFQSL
jgi:hypothetical protein